jgi:hypothetical protein
MKLLSFRETFQIANNKYITMTKIQNDNPLFGSLDIEIWDLFGIWCLYIGIWHYPIRAGKPFIVDVFPLRSYFREGD